MGDMTPGVIRPSNAPRHITRAHPSSSDVVVALCDAYGRWTADYVRPRFSAHKPAS
jgi:hypothetical protein